MNTSRYPLRVTGELESRLRRALWLVKRLLVVKRLLAIPRRALG
jgi:hypothetical protein